MRSRINPCSSPRTSWVHLPLQTFDSCSEALDNVPNVSHFVELRLELIDLPDDITKTSNLGVGSSHRSARARGLVHGGDLGLRRELQREYLVSKCLHASTDRQIYAGYMDRGISGAGRSVCISSYVAYLLNTVLYSAHQAFKVLAQGSQAPRVQHQPAIARGGSTCGARGGS